MVQIEWMKWILFFYVYSFLGWIFECCYVSIKKKEWVNRGFLKGPMLPIYGSGAVMMLFVSKPYEDDLFMTFILGMIGATLLELVTGWLIEKIFKVRYWDYSHQRFHFKGYICLSSSIAWGFFTIIMNKVIHPFILSILPTVPDNIYQLLLGLVSVYFVIDVTSSTIEALELRNMLLTVEDLKQEMHLLKKRADVIIACIDDDVKNFKQNRPGMETIERYIREMEEKLEGIHNNGLLYNRLTEKRKRELLICRSKVEKMKKNMAHIRLRSKKPIWKRVHYNPTMRSVKYAEAWETLKESLDKRQER